MTTSDRHGELFVVVDFVGSKKNWGILVLGGAASREFCGSGWRSADHKDRGQEGAECPSPAEAPASALRSSPHQPSSRCSSIETPKTRLTPVGVQAARVTGTLSESPSANMTSDRKYKRKPLTTPPMIIKVAPPRRCMRKLKVAATKTIAHNKNGRASNTLNCRRWRCAENPDCSSKLMKPGRSQNDIVSGDAKLSSILRGVRVVARRNSRKACGGSFGNDRMPFSMTQSPLSSLASAASIREVNCVAWLKKNRVTGSRVICGEVNFPACITI